MRRKILKTIKTALWTLLALVVLDAGLVFGFAIASPHVKKADAIVILGAAINTPAIQNRTLEALRLYEQNYAPVLVLSGGRINSNFISEAQNMQRILDKNAKGPLNLILDDEAGSTYENLINTRTKLPQAQSVIIVSDKFHLARSVIMAKSLGFKNVYFSAPDSGYYKPSELLFYYSREMAAMITYLPKFVFK